MRYRNVGAPPHIFEQAKGAIELWAWLLPAHLLEVRIGFDEADTGTVKCRSAVEYRTFNLYVALGWSKVPDEERPRWMLHEIIHSANNRIFDAAIDALEALAEGPAYEISRKMILKAMELTTTDLEESIWRKFMGDELRVLVPSSPDMPITVDARFRDPFPSPPLSPGPVI